MKQNWKGEPAMKERVDIGRWAAFVLALWLALVVTAGCANTQRAQLRTATDAYASTVSMLADLRAAGLIDDAQAGRIEVWRAAARAALDEWRAALDSGEPEASAVQSYNRAMTALTKELLQAEGKDSG